MSSTFNSVDYFVMFIFGISIIMGFLRGFLKEVVSLITWIAATAISTLFSSKLAAAFGGTVTATGSEAMQGNYTHVVALGVSFVIIFIGTLFAGYLFNIIVVGILQGAFISLPNRLLGALFGAIRGFIIVIVLMFVAELTPMGAEPAWAQSVFVQAFAPTVKWFQGLVQPGLDIIRTKAQGAIDGIKQNIPSSPDIQNLIGGSSSSP